MNKQNLIHTYNEINTHPEKVRKSCHNATMDEPENIMLSEISQPQNDKCRMIPLR